MNERRVILALFKQDEGTAREPLELVDVRVREPGTVEAGRSTRQQLACPVRDVAGAVGGGICNLRRSGRVASLQRGCKVELEHDVEPRRPNQLEGPLEE